MDAHVGKAVYISVTTRGQFSPNTVINDARQRELFRMVHSRRPLQERMGLFWHNHFATAYSKINGAVGSVHATRMMAGRPDQVPGNILGQYEKSVDSVTHAAFGVGRLALLGEGQPRWQENRSRVGFQAARRRVFESSAGFVVFSTNADRVSRPRNLSIFLNMVRDEPCSFVAPCVIGRLAVFAWTCRYWCHE